jgi:hypothetical protein
MRKVTRNIDPASARDLLKRVPRACIGFAHGDEPQAQPVNLVWRDERYFIGLPPAAAYQPENGQEAVLLVDEGVYFFDLRAIYIRGLLQPTLAPAGAPTGSTWYELTPTKTVAWDYGTLHEVDDDD